MFFHIFHGMGIPLFPKGLVLIPFQSDGFQPLDPLLGQLPDPLPIPLRTEPDDQLETIDLKILRDTVDVPISAGITLAILEAPLPLRNLHQGQKQSKRTSMPACIRL